jgi:hypothetical protein
MRAILLLIIGLNILAVAGAASDWEEHDVRLNWGESVSFYNYNITAVDFRPGTVEENPEKCKTETDGVNRRIFGCDDWVFLKIYKDSNHILDAVLAEKNITIDGADFFNETSYEDDESSLRIIAQDVVTGYHIPTPYAELKILIKMNESDFDIAKNLTITKTVPAEANINPCNQFIPITITVESIGNLNFSNIGVGDSVGDGFVSEPHDLKWSISLHSGEMWQTAYKIKPLKPVAGAEYSLPPAMLYIGRYNKTYNLSTGNLSFILRSSDIILSKTVDMEKEGNVTINLSVKNNGSRAASVKVWDSFVPGMEMLRGDRNFSIVLQPETSYNQSYVLKINNLSGNISLPPANFTFDEYRSCYDPEGKTQAITGSGISNPVQITFAKAVPTEVHIAPAETSPAPPIEKSKNTSDTPAFYESLMAELKNLPTKLLKILGLSGKTSGQTATGNMPAYSGGD